MDGIILRGKRLGIVNGTHSIWISYRWKIDFGNVAKLRVGLFFSFTYAMKSHA